MNIANVTSLINIGSICLVPFPNLLPPLATQYCRFLIDTLIDFERLSHLK